MNDRLRLSGQNDMNSGISQGEYVCIEVEGRSYRELYSRESANVFDMIDLNDGRGELSPVNKQSGQ